MRYLFAIICTIAVSGFMVPDSLAQSNTDRLEAIHDAVAGISDAVDELRAQLDAIAAAQHDIMMHLQDIEEANAQRDGLLEDMIDRQNHTANATAASLLDIRNDIRALSGLHNTSATTINGGQYLTDILHILTLIQNQTAYTIPDNIVQVADPADAQASSQILDRLDAIEDKLDRITIDIVEPADLPQNLYRHDHGFDVHVSLFDAGYVPRDGIFQAYVGFSCNKDVLLGEVSTSNNRLFIGKFAVQPTPDADSRITARGTLTELYPGHALDGAGPDTTKSYLSSEMHLKVDRLGRVWTADDTPYTGNLYTLKSGTNPDSDLPFRLVLYGDDIVSTSQYPNHDYLYHSGNLVSRDIVDNSLYADGRILIDTALEYTEDGDPVLYDRPINFELQDLHAGQSLEFEMQTNLYEDVADYMNSGSGFDRRLYTVNIEYYAPFEDTICQTTLPNWSLDYVGEELVFGILTDDNLSNSFEEILRCDAPALITDIKVDFVGELYENIDAVMNIGEGSISFYRDSQGNVTYVHDSIFPLGVGSRVSISGEAPGLSQFIVELKYFIASDPGRIDTCRLSPY